MAFANGLRENARALLRFQEGCRKGSDSEQRGFRVNSDQHFRAAQSTYNGFVGLVKGGTIACIIVAALVVLLIS